MTTVSTFEDNFDNEDNFSKTVPTRVGPPCIAPNGFSSSESLFSSSENAEDADFVYAITAAHPEFGVIRIKTYFMFLEKASPKAANDA